jgi:hypothetical protein
MKTAFKTANGRLTSYALNCGYIERHDTDRDSDVNVRTTLWAEHGVFHVRQHEFGGRGRLFWDTFPKISDARNRFYNATK